MEKTAISDFSLSDCDDIDGVGAVGPATTWRGQNGQKEHFTRPWTPVHGRPRPCEKTARQGNARACVCAHTQDTGRRFYSQAGLFYFRENFRLSEIVSQKKTGGVFFSLRFPRRVRGSSPVRLLVVGSGFPLHEQGVLCPVCPVRARRFNMKKERQRGARELGGMGGLFTPWFRERDFAVRPFT